APCDVLHCETDSSRGSRGSPPRPPSHSGRSSARVPRSAWPSPLRRPTRRPTSAAPARRRRPSAAGIACPSPDCAGGSFPQPPRARRDPPFFGQLLGHFEPHRHVADLRLEPPQLPLLGIQAPAFEPLLPTLQKYAAPLLDLRHRHLNLARYLVDRFPADHPQHDLGLPLRTPPLGQIIRSLRRHRAL